MLVRYITVHSEPQSDSACRYRHTVTQYCMYGQQQSQFRQTLTM